jgi:RNA polymerase sigma-70 factor (ECF subfamily)
MTVNPAGVNSEVSAGEKAELIREAIESDFTKLRSAIAAIVRSSQPRVGRVRQAERVDEVLAEVACQALARPDSYQAGRPIFPWLVGIARNVLRGEARSAARRPRQAEVDDSTWERLFGILPSPDGPASDRIDTESMLAQLSPAARMALECRFWKGLDGRDLAEALGTPSEGAARVRVARALQKLRELLAPDAPEVTR